MNAFNFYYSIDSTTPVNLAPGQYALLGGIVYQNINGNIVVVQRAPFLFMLSDQYLRLQKDNNKVECVCQEGVYFNLKTKEWDLFKLVKSPCLDECVKLYTTVCDCDPEPIPSPSVLSGNLNISLADFRNRPVNSPFTSDVSFRGGVPFLRDTFATDAPSNSFGRIIRNINGTPTQDFGLGDYTYSYVDFDNIGTNIPVKPNTSYSFKLEAVFEPLVFEQETTLYPSLVSQFNNPTYHLTFSTDSNNVIRTDNLMNNQGIFMVIISDTSVLATFITPVFITNGLIIPTVCLFVDQVVPNTVSIGAFFQNENNRGSIYKIVPGDKSSIVGKVYIEYISI